MALIPAGVPAVVQAMLVAGNELQDLPYGPLGHPDPLGATAGGLLEHGQLRPLPLGRPAARQKSSGTTRSPRTTSIGASPVRGAGSRSMRPMPRPRTCSSSSPDSGSTRHTTGPTSAPTTPRTALAGGSCLDSHLGPLGRPPSTRPISSQRHERQGGRLPADRRRARLGELCALAAGGRGRGGGTARRPRARPAVQPPRVLQGLPAGGGDPRGAAVPPRGVVEGAEDRVAHRDDRDGPGPGGAHGQALEQGGGPLRQGAARHAAPTSVASTSAALSSRTSTTCARSATPTRSAKGSRTPRTSS